MSETHLLENQEVQFKNIFNNYELKYVPAVKSAIYGRGSGGILFAYRKNLTDIIRFKRVSESYLFDIRLGKDMLYLVPVYINCSNWQSDFSKLSETLQEVDSSNLMLIGDFNGRVGVSQNNFFNYQLPFFNTVRKSKDAVCDKKGEQILDLADAYNCHILNGSCTGDSEGEFTFIRGTANSTIDLCFISGLWNNAVKDFRVGTETFSDHMPLEVMFESSQNLTPAGTKRLNLIPKLFWNERNKQQFQTSLNNEIRKLHELNVSFESKVLITIIKDSNPQIQQTEKKIIFKQKWFDSECTKARETSFSFLKLFRSHNLPIFRKLYADANTQYKRICRAKKSSFEQKAVMAINKASNSVQFWKAVKTLNESTNIISLNLDAQSLQDHFKSLLNTTLFSPLFLYAAPLVIDDFLDAPFSIAEVKNIIENCKSNKAPGDDRIPYEFYKNATDEYIALLTNEFNRIFQNSIIPDEFKKSIIFPLFKKGNAEDPANYRGIAFLNTIAKLFAGIIENRLSDWVRRKRILSEFQAGFRRSYSTIDHIFSLYNIVDYYLQNKKKLYVFFVDFRAAFDSVTRDHLFYKLSTIGLSSKIINTLRALYTNNTAYVWDGKSISDEFRTEMGLKQGCILSALLFVLYINDITDAVGGGISFGGIKIPALMYADDIVFFSERVDGLQLMMNKLKDYCKCWNLQVNLSKSKVMIFRGGGGRNARNEKWSYNGETVEIVREYKYLGVLFTSNLNMKKHLEGKLKEAKRGISAVWERCFKNRCIEHSAKQKLFRSTASAILLYGSQVWGYNSFELVEKCLRYFIKRIFCLPNNTPNYMLYLETGVAPMFMETLYLHFNYIVKIFEMSDERLPKIILKNTIRTSGSMPTEWRNLAAFCNSTLTVNQNEQLVLLQEKFKALLERFGKALYDRYLSEARESTFRSYYSRLIFDNRLNTYFLNSNQLHKISIIFKTRGELLPLNFIPHRPDLPILCSLCNRNEREDIKHFIAICPILNEFRIRHFGKQSLNDTELLDILNGSVGWDALYSYVVAALRYRNCIVNEDF